MPPVIFNSALAVPRPLSRDMVYARTRQLAVMAGRKSGEITQHDYEQAKRELTGVADPDQQLVILSRPS